MRFRVHPLFNRGRRRPWREVSNSPALEGELLTRVLTARDGTPVRVTTLRDPRHPVGDALLPDLYDPVLVLVGPGSLRLRGIERGGVVQEWQCELTADGTGHGDGV